MEFLINTLNTYDSAIGFVEQAYTPSSLLYTICKDKISLDCMEDMNF